MLTNTNAEYAGGIIPNDFVTFIKVIAILGFFACLAFVSALVYRGIRKVIGPEEAKKYRWVVVVVDIAVLFIFGFMYFVII